MSPYSSKARAQQEKAYRYINGLTRPSKQEAGCAPNRVKATVLYDQLDHRERVLYDQLDHRERVVVDQLAVVYSRALACCRSLLARLSLPRDEESVC